MVTGFSECIDSFFAFGLFALARRSGFFPSELIETFEPVMQEEARHILFFVNWVAWHRRNLAWWRRPWFWAKIAAVWVCLIKERIGLARGVGAGKDEIPQDNNFTLTGSKAVADIDVAPADLLDNCLAENARRMQGYDPRLVRDSGSEALPLSQVGGYVLGARAATLAGVPGTLAAASTIVDVTLEFVAQIAYTGLGLAWLIYLQPGHPATQPILVGLVVAIGAAGVF